jgi:alpha-glucosidase (family GH31 glycosyl hydrolase)
VESTFIFANAIKVSPILTTGVKTGTQFTSYFPKGQWVSLVNPAEIVTGSKNVQLTATTKV